MRYFALVLCLTSAVPAWPQACEAPPATRKVLDQLQVPDDARLPAAKRKELKLEPVRKALATAPSDIFLHEAYQRIRLGGMEINRTPIVTEYEALLTKHPNDPVFLYLAANAQMGRKTKAAIANLDRALEFAPSFGLPHLLLAQIYNARAYEDASQVSRHLARFGELCPESVRTLPALRWSKDKDLIGREAVRLRKSVAARADSEAVAAYPTLWSLEQALQRSDQQAQNLARMRQDLDRLSHPGFARDSAWLSTFSALRFIDGAPEDAGRKAQTEVAALYPNSAAALNEEQSNALAGLEYPKEESPERVQAYWRKRWQATLPLIRKWPASQSLADWAARGIAQDRSATPEEVAEVMALFKRAIELDPDGLRSSPPEPIWVSQLLANRGGRLDDVPDLVFAGFAAVNRESGKESANDVAGSSAAALEKMADAWYLMGYLPLADAFVRLGRMPSAKDVLLQIDEKLRKVRPPEDASSSDKSHHAELEAQFWFLRGLFAEKEGRKMDALVDYRNAIGMYPPRRPRPDRRDEVMAGAERLWKELGGTQQGWNDWASQSPLRTFYAGSGGSGAWSKLAESSPNLILTDTLGNRWKPQDLAKKTVFVNMWASWCGPCRAELPYLEKLYLRFRNRDDVAVLALNVDDDPKAMTTALQEIKVSIPSIAARDFAYSIVAQMALPANWIITPAKTEMFYEGATLDAWLESAAKAIEKAAGK